MFTITDEPLTFSLPWAIPFMGVLASLAFAHLLAPKFWRHHYAKVLGGWILSFLCVLVGVKGLVSSLHFLFHTLIHHYIPFMALITVLFTVGGGIHITMKGKASPLLNASLLGCGALLANVIGTTGASMLFIRPIIALNKYRRYATHVIIFFIFLVSNIGGILTPLGDPPLFIGFLNGVDFFWTATQLLYPFLFVGGITLTIFWLIDHYYFYHDPLVHDPSHMHGEARITIKGLRNFLFLGAAIIAVVLESKILEHPFSFFGLPIPIIALGRDLFLFSMAYFSWKLTPASIHEANHFTWEPLEEVALVFLAIFITVIPVLSMLKSGEAGPLKEFIHIANPNGAPNSLLYFWLTGILSSLLDNAPTYLVFFNMAGGDASTLMTQGARILIAISTGAVFMGALTYIGNAPNFMVRAIAVRSHIKMPGFLGYLLWSWGILLPIFFCFSLMWF